MGYIVARLHGGKEVTLYSEFNIGDYVEVINSGYQYPAYSNAFIYFWGNTETYNIPWGLRDEDKIEETPKLWKIINMAIHESYRTTILYHIRSRDGKNCVVGEEALKLADYHYRDRTPIHKRIIYQLCNNPTPHEWKEKLYKIKKKEGTPLLRFL